VPPIEDFATAIYETEDELEHVILKTVEVVRPELWHVVIYIEPDVDVRLHITRTFSKNLLLFPIFGWLFISTSTNV
jgi:hypothetical protein